MVSEALVRYESNGQFVWNGHERASYFSQMWANVTDMLAVAAKSVRSSRTRMLARDAVTMYLGILGKRGDSLSGSSSETTYVQEYGI